MMVIKFRSDSDHKDILHKVKKMKEFTQDLEECLEEAVYEDEPEYRGGRSYRREFDDDDTRMEGRYSDRRGSRRGM